MNRSKLPSAALTATHGDLLQLVFDEAWYRGRYPRAVHRVAQGLVPNLLIDFLVRGLAAGESPGPLIDTYLLRQGEQPISFLRYLTGGGSQAPCPLFDERDYLRRYPEVVAAIKAREVVSGYHHFLKTGYRDQRRGHPFALTFGTRQRLGLTRQTEPLADWRDLMEGRSAPGPLFDLDWYSAMHQADLLASDLTALQHFARNHSQAGCCSLPDFDADYYVAHQPDLKSNDPFLHYLFYGIREELAPNDYFNPRYYLNCYPLVAREIAEFGLLGSFEHFLLLGRARGWRAHPPLAHDRVAERSGKALFERRAARLAAEVRLGERIALPAPREPLTASLIIPAVDHYPFSLQLCAQLASQLSPDTEVILIDSASRDETRAIETVVEHLRVIRTDQRESFAANCNRGAQAARGDVLVIMNNDILPRPQAITRACHRLQADLSIGAVGARIIRTHGLLQEAGCVLWSTGATAGIGRDEPAHAHNHLQSRDVDFCSACFLAVRRDLFTRIGGFDEAFSPGYSEDVDLAIRLWQAGARVVYDPSVVVEHYEYASYASGRPPGAAIAQMLAQQQRLATKHRAVLRDQPPPGDWWPLFAGDRRYRTRPTILLIEDYAPERRLGSGFVRSVDLIAGLVARAFNVVVWARQPNRDQDEVYPDLAQVHVIQGERCVGGLDAFLAQHGDLFRAIWVCRTHNMRLYCAVLDAWKARYPHRWLIADTEALAALRDLEQRRVFAADTTPASRALERELTALASADRIIAVSEAEQQIIREALPAADCRRLAHIADWPRQDLSQSEAPAFSERCDFGFLGAVHGPDVPNVDSILWLCHQVWPLLRQRFPRARLRLAGYWDSGVDKPELPTDQYIDWVGPVADPGAFLREIRVFLAPTRFAAGLPHKLATAAAHGVPAVVSPLLHRQMGWEDGQGYLTPPELTPGAFAESAGRLYQDAALWTRVREAGLVAAQREFGPEAFAGLLDECLDGLVCNQVSAAASG